MANEYPPWAVALFLLGQAANLLSLGGSLWLSRRINRLPVDTQSRLFPRQLRLFCLSDVIFHMAEFLLVLSEVTGLVSVDVWGSCICTTMILSAQFGNYASSFCALHTAVAFALQSMRCERALDCWTTCFLLIWPSTIPLMVPELYYYPYRPQHGICQARPVENYIYPITNLIIFSFCLFCCFILVIGEKGRRPNTSRSFRRAVAYPMVYVATQSLLVIWSFFARTRSVPFYAMVWFMRNLTGFLNAAVYFIQGHRVSQTLRRYIDKAQSREDDVSQISSPATPYSGGVVAEDLVPLPWVKRSSGNPSHWEFDSAPCSRASSGLPSQGSGSACSVPWSSSHSTLACEPEPSLSEQIGSFL